MITAVVTAHDDHDGLHKILLNLSTQTMRPSETIVIMSDMFSPEFWGYGEFYPCRFIEQENMNDWGQLKRATGLRMATADYVGFFNADDEYDDTYIEKMLAAAETEIVYCNWISHLSGYQVQTPQPRIGRVTSGNFIVDTQFAQSVGYNHRNYTADGKFIEELVAAGARCTHVDEMLYIHN